MGSIVLNERIFAEDAIKNSKLGTKPIETLNRVAKYYHNEGYSPKKIENMLETFLLRCDPTINPVKWQTTITKLTKSAGKYKLIEIDGIRITKDEMDKIQQLHGKMSQRLMFTMLCLAKYGNMVSPSNNCWVNRKDNEIFKLANIVITTKRQSLMINDLWALQYIGYSRVVDNININVKIINEESPTVLYVTDFRNLGNQYMKYCGEKYIECQYCGQVVRQNRNVQKYCSACAVEIDRQKSIERYRKSTLS